MTVTGQQFELTSGPFTATVVEVGAGLRRFTANGRDVTLPYAADELTPKACGAVLVPWPNRIRDGRYRFDGEDLQLALTEPAKHNASHGLGRWDRWSVVARSAAEVTLALDVVPQPGWPFELGVSVTYALDAQRGLSVTARAANTGTRRLPFGMGFHPYLAADEVPMSEVAVRLAAAQRFVTDEASIPVGREPVAGTPYDLAAGPALGQLRLDDGFAGLARSDGRVRVEVRVGAGGARVWMDEAFGYTQLFTAEGLVSGRNGVAVEPMTCPADAFNSGEGLVVLEPGAAWSGRWGIEPL